MPIEMGTQKPSTEVHSSTRGVWSALEKISETNPEGIRQAVTAILEAFGLKVKKPQEPRQ